MLRLLQGVALITFIWYALSPQPNNKVTTKVTIQHDTVMIDTIREVSDTVTYQDVDQLLKDVGLTFDFLSDRIGREMFWDDNGNLMVKGDKADTVYLSASWTNPRMIEYPHTVYEEPIKVMEARMGPIKDTYDAPKNYIETWAPVAQEMMKKSGVPASIKLAQAILESGWGKGGPATHCNNHFGIKCHGLNHHLWKNKQRVGEILHHCKNFHDDHSNDMFRNYKSVAESFEAHNQLLLREWDKNTGNYGRIWKEIPVIPGNIKRTFYQKKSARLVFYKGKQLQDGQKYSFPYWVWMAIELRNEGYATDKNYATKVANMVAKYKLYKYDEIFN